MLPPSRLFLGFAFSFSVTAVDSAPLTQLNILWIVSEDNTFNYVGTCGDSLALASAPLTSAVLNREPSSSTLSAPMSSFTARLSP
jgi:hypothetical protein